MGRGIGLTGLSRTIILLLAVILTALPWSSLFAKDQELAIAMFLWLGETEAEKGFKEGLYERGYRVNYTQFDLDQDLKRLGEALNQVTSDIDRYDYIYTFGTTVSRRTKLVINERIPHLFTAVTDPVGSGIISSLDTTDENIAGATDLVPLTMQISEIQQVVEVKKLGLFFNPREKNSMLIREELYRLANQNDFQIVDFRSPPQGDFLLKNLNRLIDSPGLVDAVFIPSDSYLNSQAQLIGEKLLEAQVAGFSSLKELIENGVMMGVVIDYFQLGKALAESIDHHQKHGEFQNNPVLKAEQYDWLINVRTQNKLGVKLSDEVRNRSTFIEQ